MIRQIISEFRENWPKYSFRDIVDAAYLYSDIRRSAETIEGIEDLTHVTGETNPMREDRMLQIARQGLYEIAEYEAKVDSKVRIRLDEMAGAKPIAKIKKKFLAIKNAFGTSTQD